MKEFITKILQFLLIPFCIAILLDLFISGKMKHSSDHPWENEVWNEIYQGKVEADIVIYGSSKGWTHFNPVMIEQAFNLPCYTLGLNASNILWQHIRHKEYLKFNPPPKLIILSLDINTLIRKTTPTNYYMPYMLWRMDIYRELKRYNNVNKGVDYIMPLIRYLYLSNLIGETNLFRSLLKVNARQTHVGDSPKILKTHKTGTFRYKGHRGMNIEWTRDFREAKQKYESYTIQIDTALISFLEHFIEVINRQNIDLIFVYSPTYIEGQHFVENRDQIVSIFNNLSEKHDIPFFDYSDSLISYRKELFYNTQHLNKKGSELFTRQLIEDLRKHEQTASYIQKAGGIIESHEELTSSE